MPMKLAQRGSKYLVLLCLISIGMSGCTVNNQERNRVTIKISNRACNDHPSVIDQGDDLNLGFCFTSSRAYTDLEVRQFSDLISPLFIYSWEVSQSRMQLFVAPTPCPLQAQLYAALKKLHPDTVLVDFLSCAVDTRISR
jgi:hypothetical protein